MNKFAVFAYGDVGISTIKMFRENKEQLEFVLLDENNFWDKNQEILNVLSDFPRTKVYYYENDYQLTNLCKGLDAVILAWWGKIIKKDLLKIPKYGFINLHTSYLPYGKGKHPHYWSIIEESPYGVTIMKIDEGLDTGTIIFQENIPITWEDTGKSLYFKGIKTISDLLERNKEKILNLDFEDYPQDTSIGSFHYGKEIEESSFIDLEKTYKARDLLNIIRARTFQPFPAAYFYENGIKYEIRVEIKKSEKFNPEKIRYSEINSD